MLCIALIKLMKFLDSQRDNNGVKWLKNDALFSTPEKMFSFSSQKKYFILLFLHKNICYGYSLDAPQQGAFNEHKQHMFLQWNKKNIYLNDYPCYLEFCFNTWVFWWNWNIYIW